MRVKVWHAHVKARRADICQYEFALTIEAKFDARRRGFLNAQRVYILAKYLEEHCSGNNKFGYWKWNPNWNLDTSAYFTASHVLADVYRVIKRKSGNTQKYSWKTSPVRKYGSNYGKIRKNTREKRKIVCLKTYEIRNITSKKQTVYFQSYIRDINVDWLPVYF